MVIIEVHLMSLLTNYLLEPSARHALVAFSIPGVIAREPVRQVGLADA
jgi:hypothetical protein